MCMGNGDAVTTGSLFMYFLLTTVNLKKGVVRMLPAKWQTANLTGILHQQHG